ncbi:hypothetical protein [Streptomyces sp. enrichment culture]|uniref:hypothetical protein n=1 Tax=Streptomyces sp. enrichment culture TaxID=1795815 RepID=UPI003F559E61
MSNEYPALSSRQPGRTGEAARRPHTPPYAHGPQPPGGMPAAVRAAQVVIFVLAGLGVVHSSLVGAFSGAEAAGKAFAPYLTAWALLVLAFLFPTAGRGVRAAALVLGSVQIVLALGGAVRGTPFGILPLAGAVAVVVLLGQGSAGDWFRRHRAR